MKKIILLISLSFLLGCEAPLILDGVTANEKEPIRRTDVFMSTADNGNKSIIVGSEGLIIYSESGKPNWQRYQLANKPALIDISSCANGMFAILSMEGKVFTSTDNADNWTEIQIPSQEIPQAITCDVNNSLWVVGSFSTIFSSADSGNTWKEHSLNEDMILSSIQFFDDKNGIITGEFGTVLLTEDGGESWEFSEPIPNEFFPLASVFKDSQQGWVVGLDGIIYSTNNGGLNWQREETHINAPLFGISLKGNSVIAVGDYGTIIYRNINDSLDSWQSLDIPAKSRFFYRVGFPVKNNKLIIAGAAGSLELIDVSKINL